MGKEILDRFDEQDRKIDESFNKLDAKTDKLDAKTDELAVRIDKLDAKIDEKYGYISLMFEEIKGDFKTLIEGHTVLDNKIDRVAEDLEEHKKENNEMFKLLNEKMDRGFAEAKSEREKGFAEAKSEREKGLAEARADREGIKEDIKEIKTYMWFLTAKVEEHDKILQT